MVKKIITIILFIFGVTLLSISFRDNSSSKNIPRSVIANKPFKIAVANASEETPTAQIPTIQVLFTEGCPACQMIKRTFQEINTGFHGKIKAEEIDLQSNPDVARAYQIRYIPTLLYFDAQGNEIAREIGYRPLEHILEIFRMNGVDV